MREGSYTITFGRKDFVYDPDLWEFDRFEINDWPLTSYAVFRERSTGDRFMAILTPWGSRFVSVWV